MAMLFNYREAEERQKQRHCDDMKREYDLVHGRGYYPAVGLQDHGKPRTAGNYVSTPENAKDPLIKRNKKLLLLTT